MANKETDMLSESFDENTPEDAIHVIIGPPEDQSRRWATSLSMNDSLVLDEIAPMPSCSETINSAASQNSESDPITELAETVYNCAINGTDIDVASCCVAVMSKLRGIPPKRDRCNCIYCCMEPNWRNGPIAEMNGSCGAHAWKSNSDSVDEPVTINPLVERTWESVSKLVDRWGQSLSDRLTLADYKTINQFGSSHSFSPLQLIDERYPDISCFHGANVIAIGSEGMLNGAGMDEQYPGTEDYVQEWIVHDEEHFWVDCAAGLDYFGEFDITISSIGQMEQYACVSHTWGRGWCKGEGICGVTEEYRMKHVCDKEWGEWDERDIVEVVMATGWNNKLWLDWVDIPTEQVNKKANKIKTQAELFADAARVFVFVPNYDFKSIKSALRLSEAAVTIGEFVDVIHLLSGVKWFSSQWTLQEMFMSYERMVVVSPGVEPIGCGWLETLKLRLAALLDTYWMHLNEDDMANLNSLGILQLGTDVDGQMVTAALMRCRGKTYKMRMFDSIREGLICDVPGGIPACAQLIHLAVDQDDVSWLAFKADRAEGKAHVRTMPLYGAKWPGAGRWQTVCDVSATGAGLLWFGATGMVKLSEAIQYWYDEDATPEPVVGAECQVRVIVLCVRPTGVSSEQWLGMLVLGASGRTQRLGGCVLQPSQMQLFKSGAALVI